METDARAGRGDRGLPAGNQRTAGAQRQRRVGVCPGGPEAAQQCDCAVIALSQLLRDAEGGKPQLRHLYGSSGIESAADVIMLLHRDKEEAP
ncbi:DnaB-like helicase C-terminal domain-containing protein, partial [Alicyclobacillus kakegawensis]|uniref:DnaB-like helicase C-terminal domain-containing protein n=1 Tax=Alicyclobacillus kakegawensis TaxID=392012 RepID=UPI001C3F47F7